MKAYGAELVLTEGAKGMKGAIAKADVLDTAVYDEIIPASNENAFAAGRLMGHGGHFLRGRAPRSD